MAVVAQGEIDLRLSKESTSRIEKDLSAASKKAGAKAGSESGQEFGKGFNGKLGPALSSLGGKLKDFGKDGELALNPVSELQAGTSKLANSLGALGPAGLIAGGALAALAGIGAKGIQEFINLTGEIRRFRDISGASAQDSSKLVVALDELGVSSDQVARGISKLARASVDGKEPLAQYGIQISRTKDGNFDAIKSFDTIADHIHNTSDAAERNAIAFSAFGRAGLQLIPVLSRGSEVLKEYENVAKLRGEVFSDADLARARNFTIATKSLGDAFKGLEIAVGQRAVGPITSGTIAITAAVDDTTKHLNSMLDSLGAKSKDKTAFGVALLNTVLPGSLRFLGSEASRTKQRFTELQTAEESFAKSSKADLDKVSSASDALSFVQNNLAQALIQDNLKTFGKAASGAAIALSTDLKTGVTDYGKALAQLDPIASRVITDQAKIAEGLDPIAAKFDLTAAAADQFTQALSYTLTPFENVKQAQIDVTKAQDTLTKTLADGKSTQTDLSEAALTVVKSLQSQEEALIRDSDGSITAAQAKDQLLSSLDKEIAKYPRLRGELSGYRDEVAKTPPEKLIDFKSQGLSGPGGLTDSLDALNQTLSELKQVFELKFRVDPQSYIDLDKFKNYIPPKGFTYFDPVATPSTGPQPPKRAGGGPVFADTPYLVGEKRPEIFEPKQDGWIHPDAGNWSPKYAGQSKHVTFGDVNVYEVQANPQATAFAAMSQIADALLS